MKPLLIIRHAIALERAEAAAQGLPDSQRALTPKGEERMRRIAATLGKWMPEPATLLSSPYLRTRQTAALLSTQWQQPFRECKALAPGGDPAALLRQLDKLPGPIVLVGHEPDLSELIGLLLGGQARSVVRLKKGGAALLHLEEPLQPGNAELQWLINPKQLLGLD